MAHFHGSVSSVHVHGDGTWATGGAALPLPRRRRRDAAWIEAASAQLLIGRRRPSRYVGNSVHLAAVAEALSSADAITATMVAVAALDESAALTDEQGTGPLVTATIAESATLSDALSAALAALAASAEAAAAGDMVAVVLSTSAEAVEAAVAVDAVLTGSGVFAAVSESATAADAVAALLPQILVDAVEEAAALADVLVAVVGNAVVIYSAARGTPAPAGRQRPPQLGAAGRPAQTATRRRL